MEFGWTDEAKVGQYAFQTVDIRRDGNDTHQSDELVEIGEEGEVPEKPADLVQVKQPRSLHIFWNRFQFVDEWDFILREHPEINQVLVVKRKLAFIDGDVQFSWLVVGETVLHIEMELSAFVDPVVLARNEGLRKTDWRRGNNRGRLGDVDGVAGYGPVAMNEE